MVFSACFPGGCANTTANEKRLMYPTFFTRGWMRQERNPYLANEIEQITKLPEWFQERIGYGLSRPVSWMGQSVQSDACLTSGRYRDLW